jgi:hypothetical protein
MPINFLFFPQFIHSVQCLLPAVGARSAPGPGKSMGRERGRGFFRAAIDVRNR